MSSCRPSRPCLTMTSGWSAFGRRGDLEHPPGVAYHFDGSSWSRAGRIGPVSGASSARRVSASWRWTERRPRAPGRRSRAAHHRPARRPDCRAALARLAARRRTCGRSATRARWCRLRGHNLASVASGTTGRLRDVWGTGPSDVWVGSGRGDAAALRRARVHVDVVGDGRRAARGVHADPGDVWIAGDAGVLRRGGSGGFGDVVVPGVSGLPIRDLHGLASDDVWLAGGTSMFTQTGPMTGFWSGTGSCRTSTGRPGLRSRC